MATSKLLNKYVLLKIIIQDVVRLLCNQPINIRQMDPAKVDFVGWIHKSLEMCSTDKQWEQVGLCDLFPYIGNNI